MNNVCLRTLRWLVALVSGAALVGVVGCGAARVASSSLPNPTNPTPSQNAQFGHVVLLVEENHSYKDVIGSASMPYFNSLASTYGLATQYFANLHPSIPNYFMLTTGDWITIDDAYSQTVNQDNLARELNAAKKSWKVYAESLPATGYLGYDQYPYLKHHNPFAYFNDVVQHPDQASKMVNFNQFPADLGSGQLPNFSYVVPNTLDDAHDGTLNQADVWLQTNIDPLVKNPAFQKDGLLIITFDEGDQDDLTNGGGQVATLIISSRAKKKFQSTTLYQHQSTLRLILQSLGISSFPGAASAAPPMNEFFQ